VSDEEKALINRKRGHKNISTYILDLVYSDAPEEGLRKAIQKYVDNMKELEK
jgi:thiamine biosynthesis lipoprotein ApbE